MDNRLLLFFFSALGAFNGSLLSIYFFFFAKPKRIANYFLGALLATLSIRIWKSLFFYFNPDLAKIFLQIGLSACFFIGPFLYFYTKTVLISPRKPKKQMYYHLTFLVLLVVIIGYLYPYETNLALWRKYTISIIYYQWLGYIIATGFLLKGVFKKLLTKKKLDYEEIWVLNVYFGVFIIWLAYYTTYYTSYIVGALSFSVVLYFSIFLIFHQRKKKFSSSEKHKKYANHKIPEEEALTLMTNINQIILDQKLYKNPNLTLPKLAKAAKIRSHLLSQLLNDNLNKNFSNFINEYRIDEAKRMLTAENNLKMEVIAEECGFNSNSTFYSAFKKVTNTTPAKYAEGI